MLSDFVQAICRIGIFIICAQTIIHFRPKASYEKYIRMLVSAMVLIQLFFIIGNYFSPEGGKALMEQAKQFAQSFEEVARQAADDPLFSGDHQELSIPGEPKEQEEEVKGEETVSEIEIQIAPIKPVQIESLQEESEGRE